MENMRANEMVVVVVVVVVVVSLVMMGWLELSPLGVMGDLHKVGGSKGWRPEVNYTEWSAEEHVHVGDWLLFNFDKRYYNVLEVNKTSYENCIERDFMRNVTRGGRDVVQLTEARAYYYLSSGGYCFHQMRVAVNVAQESSEKETLLAHAPGPASQNSAHIYALTPCVHTCTWIVVLANVVYLSLVSM